MFSEVDKATKITYLGHAAFLITDKHGVSIVTDPYSARTGYRFPEVTADIVTVSHHHHDHNEATAVGGTPTVIDTPGIHTVEGISIDGISTYHDDVRGAKRGANIIYKFAADDMVIAHMGDYGETLTADQSAWLKEIDVLMIPVGGTYTIDYKQAADIVRQVMPRVVIPMHYKTVDSTIQIAGPEPFLDEMGSVIVQGSSIEITATSLPEHTEIWLMHYIQAS